MISCSSKQGFFTLRSCREPAVRNCETCERPMCSRHLSARTGFVRCLDCVARSSEQSALQQPTTPPAGALVYRPPAHPADWAYDYRDRYYRSKHYSPFIDLDSDSYYDDYDLRSFDRDLGSGSSMGLTDGGADADDHADWGDS